MKKNKLKFPNFWRWTFEKWYFWLAVFISSLWIGTEELGLGYISEFIGIFIASFIFISFIFLCAYFIAKKSHKNLLKKINEKK